jgi:hypothetical protein
MTVRRKAHRWLLLTGALTVSNPGLGGVWGSQPVLGLLADYASNPGLLNLPDTAEEHAAILLDAPTSYVGDDSKFTVLPSFRLSNAPGYSSVDSDYEHFNASEELDADRDKTTVTAGLARDSSLYRDYILNGSLGVERTTFLSDLNWDHQLSERLDLDDDLNWSHVRYAEGSAASAGGIALTNYKYGSFSPSLSWRESERNKLTLAASLGRYNSLDGLTESTAINLQLGFQRQLSELWSVTASGGYSRSNNQDQTDQEELVPYQGGYIIVLVPVRLQSTQTGSIFSANLTRQSELLTLSVSAARQLAPTGFAFLARQDNYQLQLGYQATERLRLSTNAQQVTYEAPQFNGPASVSKSTAVSVSAIWHWSEHWTATFGASHVIAASGSPTTTTDTTGLSVEISRQFDWRKFQ